MKTAANADLGLFSWAKIVHLFCLMSKLSTVLIGWGSLNPPQTIILSSMTEDEKLDLAEFMFGMISHCLVSKENLSQVERRSDPL